MMNGTAKAAARRPCAGSAARDLGRIRIPFILLCRKELLTYMEIDAILTAVGSVGFPIVFCILLFAYVREQTKTHKEEVDELKNVIEENNNILAALKQLIEDKLNG